jgi:hypothetical protein
MGWINWLKDRIKRHGKSQSRLEFRGASGHCHQDTRPPRLWNAGFIRQPAEPHGDLPDKSGVPVTMSGCTRFHTSYWRGERPPRAENKGFCPHHGPSGVSPTEPPSAANFQMMTFGFETGNLSANESE